MDLLLILFIGFVLGRQSTRAVVPYWAEDSGAELCSTSSKSSSD